MLEITQRIAAGGALSAILPDVASVTLRVSRAGGVRIMLESTPSPVIFASGSCAAKMLKYDMQVAQLVSKHGTVSIPDLSMQDGTTAELAGMSDDLGAFLALPLMAQRSLRGILWVATDKPRQFTAEEQ